MQDRGRLTTIWHRDDASGTALPFLTLPEGATMLRYRIDGGGGILWIEGRDASVPVPADAGEIFNFTLFRDLGAIDAPPAPWLYIVHTDIPADVATDYNAWYDSEHLPRLVAVPGIERARRYVAGSGQSPRYLTAYDLSIKDAFESPAGLKARKTQWTEKMRSLFQNTRRSMCTLQL